MDFSPINFVPASREHKHFGWQQVWFCVVSAGQFLFFWHDANKVVNDIWKRFKWSTSYMVCYVKTTTFLKLPYFMNCILKLLLSKETKRTVYDDHLLRHPVNPVIVIHSQHWIEGKSEIMLSYIPINKCQTSSRSNLGHRRSLTTQWQTEVTTNQERESINKQK